MKKLTIAALALLSLASCSQYKSYKIREIGSYPTNKTYVDSWDLGQHKAGDTVILHRQLFVVVEVKE